MSIELYSTEARQKVKFVPITPGHINMYVCGPTVYDSCHIGHARPAVVFDTIRRHLEASGYAVTFISNITDIDDKIINRSQELGISYQELASRYQDEYERDMTLLGVRSPSIRPKATEHIPDMISLVAGLLSKGVAYQTSRGIWFDVSKFPDYGRLSGRTVDDENTEHRVEQDTEKRHAQDFALWKFSKPGEPEWDSPWGKGRPGWHLECSAMSGKYCNFSIDIHGGGADLAFPHHENELAQSEAFTGRRFVNYWLHNGFITVGKSNETEEKMGKSKGNAFWLREAFKIASPAALRLWILGTHYRMPLLYKPDLLEQAENSLSRVYNVLESLSRKLAGFSHPPALEGEFINLLTSLRQDFTHSLDDDFNTPQALAVLYELINKTNSAISSDLSSSHLKAAELCLFSFLSVLGLPLSRPLGSNQKQEDYINLLISLRSEARQRKDFSLSDRIRDGLKQIGIELNDRGESTTWQQIS